MRPARLHLLLSAQVFFSASMPAAAPAPSDDPAQAEGHQVEINRVFEAVWTSDVARPDPWSVEVRAEVRGPSGIALSIPAFHDGGKIWKARFRPTAAGSWSYRTISRDLDLNGRIGRVRCIPSAESPAIGPLRIDPADPAGFTFGEGGRPFFLGVICTRLCGLECDAPRPDRLESFLDLLRARGFNWVVFTTNPGGEPQGGPDPRHAGPFHPASGLADPDSCGPWRPGVAGPEFSQIDPSYWARVDFAVEGMRLRGIVAHIQIRGPRNAPAPPRRSREDWQYVRHVVARYHAFPNVVWDFGPESWRDGDRAYKTEVMLRVGEWDPYDRPRTVSDDDARYRSGAYDFLSFRTLRVHREITGAIEEARRPPARPLVVAGYGTETGAGAGILHEAGFDDGRSTDDIVLRSWQVALAGAIPVAAAAGVSWDVLRPDVEPAGWAKLGILRRVFEGAGQGLRPAPELVRAGKALCLAKPGESYLALLEEERLVTIRFRGIERRLQAVWLDPDTGESRDAGSVEDGDRTFHRPEGFGRLGAVLRIGREPLRPGAGT